MALYIDDPEIEQLAAEIAAILGTTVEEAIKEALREYVEELERRQTSRRHEAS
jgi:hypothetical protein